MRDLKRSGGRSHSLNGIEGGWVDGEITSRKQIIHLTTSRRRFGMIVLIHRIHYREEILVEAHIKRLKTKGMLTHSNKRHGYNSSGDGE